jgi:hypothetical protein
MVLGHLQVAHMCPSFTWQLGVDGQVPEANAKAFCHFLKVWMVADHERNLTAQLACFVADQEVVQAVVLLAD